MRLSKIFSPFSNPIALVAADIRLSPRVFYLARILISVFIAALFVILGYSGAFLPVYLNLGSFLGYKVFALEESVLKLIIVFLFLYSFLGDVIINFEKKGKKKQKEDAVLSFFEQLSDAVVILGAIAFLNQRGSYYNFGRFLLFDLSYIEPKTRGHALLGVIAIVGILFVKYAASSTKKEPALSFGAERAFWVGIFSLLGFYFDMFSGAIFSGILLLTVSLYISALLAYASAGFYEALFSLLIAFFASVFGLLKSALKASRKLIGISLLWLYYIIEGIFEKLNEARRFVKRSIKLPKLQPRMPEPRKKEHIKSEPFRPEKTMEDIEEEKPIEHAIKTEAEPKIEVEQKKEPEAKAISKAESYSMREEKTEPGKIYLGESLLVEYSPEDNKTAVLEYITRVAIDEKRNAALVLTPPLTQQFKELLKEKPEYTGLKIVNLTGENVSPTKEEIPMTQLEYFSDLFDTLGTGDVIIFEPVSNLMLNTGTAQTYKFVSSTIEKLAQRSVTFIAFINKAGHERRDISNFENLFMHIAEISESRLKKMR